MEIYGFVHIVVCRDCFVRHVLDYSGLTLADYEPNGCELCGRAPSELEVILAKTTVRKLRGGHE